MIRKKKPILYSVGSKFLITSIVVLVLVMLVATLFSISVIRKNIRREMEEHLESDSSMSQLIFKNQMHELEDLANLTSADNTVKVTLDLGIIPQLEEHLKKVVARNNLDFFMVVNNKGLVISSSFSISTNSSFLQKQIAAALHDERASGLTLCSAGKDLMMAAVSPIWLRKQIVGTIGIGRLVNNDTEMTRLMKENIEANIMIWQNGKGVIASTLPADELIKFSISLTQLLDETMPKKANNEKIYTADLLVDQKKFLMMVNPVRDFHNEPVALIILCKSIEALKALEKRTIKNMIIISLIGVFVAIFLTTLITRSISRPIKKTVRAMIAVTEKDDLEQHVHMNPKGEVGKLVSAFNNMVDTIKKSRTELQELANTLEQKVKERTRELEEAQKELINKAMEAGRAQLSAMVLHNIGNAVTPIKVQIENMKSDELKQISQYLKKCYLDIDDHVGDLNQYVNNDPRGKNVFNYMGELIDSLTEQRKQNKGVIRKMDEAVSYISEILTLQQSYAAGEQETKERIDLNTLIEGSIRMQTGSLEKRQIIVKKDMATTLPRLLIDKNRLMQVIVNFIKNSYEAIDDLNDNNRKKWISFKSFSENGRMGLKITDNGIGIEPAHIDTIFEFGKSHKGSSGFGLYYCKMFVDANKGTLNISSPGKGKGATVEVVFET